MLQADLASIHTEEERKFVEDLNVGDTQQWLGGRKGSSVFAWSDGSHMDYQHWAAGQPDDSGGQEDCLHMWFSKGSQKVEKVLNEWKFPFPTSNPPYIKYK